MSPRASRDERWAVVLAGGDGRRLERYLHRAYGDSRPKQFCTFGGAESLLTRTVRRAIALAPEKHVVVVIQEAHRALAEEALRPFPAIRLVTQPANRDTLPGLTLPLLHIHAEDPGALVTVLPADHHIADDRGFVAAITAASARVVAEPGAVAVLGVQPTAPEDGYGWVMPKQGHEGSFSAVTAFREKPTPEEAGELLLLGAAINTFVLVGRAAKLLRLVARSRPDWFDALSLSYRDPAALARAYEALGPANFSHEVLENCPCCLRLAPLGDVGWTDVGTPERLRRVFGTPRRSSRSAPCPRVANARAPRAA